MYVVFCYLLIISLSVRCVYTAVACISAVFVYRLNLSTVRVFVVWQICSLDCTKWKFLSLRYFFIEMFCSWTTRAYLSGIPISPLNPGPKRPISWIIYAVGYTFDFHDNHNLQAVLPTFWVSRVLWWACVCACLCLYVSECILGTTRPVLTGLLHVTQRHHGSVLLCWRCDALRVCTSGFMDDVMLARNYHE